MNVKSCECCGKIFFSKSNLKKCCCKDCSREMAKRKREEYGQLCWRCKNACCGCSWSREQKPIDGWTAERTIVKDAKGDFSSYKIKNCPQFIRG